MSTGEGDEWVGGLGERCKVGQVTDVQSWNCVVNGRDLIPVLDHFDVFLSFLLLQVNLNRQGEEMMYEQVH